MPKRAIVAIVTTALALVLLFSFKTPHAPVLVAGGNGGDLPAATSRAAGVTPAAPGRGSEGPARPRRARRRPKGAPPPRPAAWPTGP